jgi:hypothetical protein
VARPAHLSAQPHDLLGGGLGPVREQRPGIELTVDEGGARQRREACDRAGDDALDAREAVAQARHARQRLRRVDAGLFVADADHHQIA